MSTSKFDLGIVSLALALATLILGWIAWTGGFSGGRTQCGDFGFACMGNAMVLMLVGTLIGFIVAVAGLVRKRGRSWYGWLGALLNGVPALALGGWLGLVLMIHG